MSVWVIFAAFMGQRQNDWQASKGGVMKNIRLSIIGVMIVLVAVLVGCGPSKEQLRQTAAKTKASAAYDQAKQAKSGDDASQARADVLAALAEVQLGLESISVEKSALDQLVADKYFTDANVQLALLRDKKTGFKAAQAAKAEFIRTQKLSGRDLRVFDVTAKGVDVLAYRRAALAPAKNKKR
jgi:hypothetical protein